MDPFGSTGTEQKVGDGNNNQGDNSKVGSGGGGTIPPNTHDYHYLD